MNRTQLFGLALIVVLWAYGQGNAQRKPDTVSFTRTQICVITASGTQRFPALLADSKAERAQGLMDREGLPEDTVMLFRYPKIQPPEAGFWMYRTKIPLTAAFLGPDGEIRAMRHMQPCVEGDASGCYIYGAGVEYAAAVEANAGFFERHAIEPGARLVVSGSSGCPPQ